MDTDDQCFVTVGDPPPTSSAVTSSMWRLRLAALGISQSWNRAFTYIRKLTRLYARALCEGSGIGFLQDPLSREHQCNRYGHLHTALSPDDPVRLTGMYNYRILSAIFFLVSPRIRSKQNDYINIKGPPNL